MKRLIIGIAGGAALMSCDVPRGTEQAIDELGMETEEVVDAIVRDVADLFSTSEDLKLALREEEGELDFVYRDSGGLATVGIGHLVTPEDGLTVGQRIEKSHIAELLETDLRRAEAHARRLLGDLPVSQNEFDAVVDLVFNVGPGNVSPTRSPALNEAIRRQDYEAVAENLRYTVDASGRQARGLIHRSERRRRIFKEGRYDNPRLG